MKSHRHLISDTLYKELLGVAEELGYKQKGVKGWQSLLKKLLAYAVLHPDLFRV